ncbi:uncharacterized protein BP5553_04225 [Venustampulla echinocandica]|uniref:Mid2 domain-containing protein n=1 Tax=Venustampulla echinocandica TaxID=2656787 RepID=A0A370TWI2_9HELO|nr:uncharacterized protein BP5553_04225 [Venustampulla echinocandica]RDL39885.1 hypothetical protein BP5553_04225 [Venustampulla echinocandica]
MAITVFAMPSSSLLLLFSVALGLSHADPFALPIQTAVYSPDEWSPRPTGAPADPAALFKRGGSVDVAVCGWIGGLSAKPVACSSGSSCIHDTIHALMGCCTTEGPCIQGVYSTCIDKKSAGWATTTGLVNNGVTTCAGDSLCYQVTYPGKYMQYMCGDPKAAAQVATTFEGQPTDMRMQIVYTGVTFSPMVPVPSAGPGTPVSPTNVNANAFSSETGGAAGKVSPVAAAPSEPPSGAPSKGTSTGAIAGGTAGAVAGVTIIVLLGVWCWRRRQKAANRRRPDSLFEPTRNEPFASPFQPVQHYNAPDEMVSPMSGMRETFAPMPGRPDTGASTHNPFHYDTAYRGGGGMAMDQRHPSFSTVAGLNPFADEVAPPIPTNRGRFHDEHDIAENRFYDNNHRFDDNHPYADNPLLPNDHLFADVAASNPFTDAQGYETIPTSGQVQKPYQPYQPLSRNQPSPVTASEQTQPLVDEIDDFSRSWQASAGSHRDPNEQSDDEDDGEDRGMVQTATSVPVAHGNLIETHSSEALNDMGRNPHERSQTPNFRNMPSETSSLLAASLTQTGLPSNAETLQRASPTNVGRATIPTMQEKIQKLAQEKAQIVRKRTESQEQIREQEEPLQNEAGIQKERPFSDTSMYSSNTYFSREDSVRSTRLPPPPAPSTTIPKRTESFGLNRAIKPALDEDLGGDDFWSSGWSGIGGGWLEGQSGRSSTIGNTDGGDGGSASGSAVAPISRKPVPNGVPVVHKPVELRDGPQRKNTFGEV